MSPMELDAWLQTLADELGLSDVVLDDNALHTILDLARDAAHEVERPAAPLTSFLIGVAVGRGQALGSAAAKATSLVLGEA